MKVRISWMARKNC